MSLLSVLGGRLISLAMVRPAIARLKRRAIRAVVGGAIVGVLGVLALIYFLIAIRLEVERHLGMLWTPVAMGGVFLVLAIIAYFVFLRSPSEKSSDDDSPLERGADVMRDSILGPARQVQQQIAQRPIPAMLAALAIGFAGASLLRTLRRRSQRDAAPGRPAAAREHEPEWTREVVFREADRSRNGRARRRTR